MAPAHRAPSRLSSHSLHSLLRCVIASLVPSSARSSLVSFPSLLHYAVLNDRVPHVLLFDLYSGVSLSYIRVSPSFSSVSNTILPTFPCSRVRNNRCRDVCGLHEGQQD